MNPPLIVIVGETASGKSKLAISLAKQFSGEIICCDSRTLYKGMDIGTAKLKKEEMDGIKHHLVNVSDPDDPISASSFQKMCKNEIDHIISNDNIPFLVGGSGLYIDSVIYDYQFSNNINETENDYLKNLSVEELTDIISKRGLNLPINKTNKRHLMSVIRNNGEQQERKLIDNCLVIGIKIPKEELTSRIINRVNMMMEEGLEGEVAALSKKYGWDIEPMKSIGYREFKAYFDEEITREELMKVIIYNTLSYSKRQRTWFKRNKNIHWIDEQSKAVELITTFLNK